MIIEKLIKKFTAKRAFVGAMLAYSLAMAILGESLDHSLTSQAPCHKTQMFLIEFLCFNVYIWFSF